MLERALDALVDLLEAFCELVLGEVTLFGVDRFALAAVDGDERTPAKRSNCLHNHVNSRQTCRRGPRLFLRKSAIVLGSGRSFFHSYINSTCRWVSCSRRRLDRRR